MIGHRHVRVILVNWNSGRQLEDAVAAVSASRLPEGTRMEVVVVDNGSRDMSLAWARHEDEAGRLQLLALEANTGFAHACNAAAAGFGGTHLLFLNPDTRVEPDAVARALGVFEDEAAAKIGIVGIQCRAKGGIIQQSCARVPTLATFLNEALGLAALAPRHFPGLHYRDFDHASSRTVPHVIGAFYLVRSEVYRALGGFDERFFVYLEDLDFSLRARQLGYACYFLADARMYHSGGGVSGQVKDLRLFYALRSRILYAFKHLAPASAWLITIVTLILEPLPRLARALVHASIPELRHTTSAFLMLYRALPAVLAVR